MCKDKTALLQSSKENKKNTTMAFLCDKCGICCQSLKQFGELYADLDDGTGCCRHFDKRSHLCKIYANRPIKCNVIAAHKVYFSHIPFEEYIQKTKLGCQKLKKAFHSS